MQLTSPASGALVTSPAVTPFASWFTAGAPGTLNAAVTPADSVNFANNPGNQNTDFYRWSYRMFLWLTSPTPATYGGTGLVLSSPEFYNLSANSAGNLVMSQNPSSPFIGLGPIERARLEEQHPAPPLHLDVRRANLGPHGLPTVHDAKGHFFEVLPTKLSTGGRPLVLNKAGREVELARVVVDARGNSRFLDRAGVAIEAPRLVAHAPTISKLGIAPRELQGTAKPQFVFRINPGLIIGGGFFHHPIFIFPTGAVLSSVVGDSDGNVQMTQNGSPIYYNISVNDVYAYYVTQINPLVNGTSAQFPTALGPTTNPPVGTLGSLIQFAAGKNHTFLNPNALALEVKSSWVDASTLPNNASGYITMRAVVPTFNTSNQALWTQSGTKTITVALIGVHVVGGTAGHPEMVWSTFEHVGNTPNAAYAFTNPGGNTVTQPADPASASPQWLFCCGTASSVPQPGSSGLYLSNAKATFSSAGVANGIQVANGATSIHGTNVSRPSPFGASSNQAPNPLISTIAQSNTQIISLNNDIHGQMNSADVRSNYFFLGATWTEGGAPPTGLFPFGNVVGASFLANSTLETFTQPKTLTSAAGQLNGCLTCHQSNTVAVSHIFPSMVALP